MATLKALRTRKTSVQSTQKITKAMKMVAAAKLRRAQEQLEAGRPYAHLMSRILQGLAQRTKSLDIPQPLLMGTGKRDIHLVLVATSDRGLCGAFNTSIVKYALQFIEQAHKDDQIVNLFCIGRRGKALLERSYKDLILQSVAGVGYPRLSFSDAQSIAQTLMNMFEEGKFDVCTLIYNKFESALRQEVCASQIIPLQPRHMVDEGPQAIYEYEPDESSLLTRLLHQNVAVQVYNVLCENAASEEGSRMAAMENASQSAEEMLEDLSLTYNRTRQSHITRELVEIIAGAEAL